MDRIREAISRARDQKPAPQSPGAPGAVGTAQRTGASPAAGYTGAVASEDFQEVTCNFESFRQNRIISNEQDPVLNAYRVLRTRTLQKMEANNWRTLAVVSPSAGAGKTVTAINLAIAIGSRIGSRATLVDLDFYRPSVARYLGISDFRSSLDFFEGKRSLEDVTLKPDLPDVLVIPNERVTRRGAELLTSPQADQLIDKTVNQYNSRVVIFDMSPLLGCDDTLAFLPKVDCVLLVTASGQTRVTDLKEARRILSNANNLGTVLNKAPTANMPNQYY